VENGGREAMKMEQQDKSRRRQKYYLLVFVVVVEALTEKREEVSEGAEGRVLFCLLIF
jgi:hypothetical protein